jgi:thioredoxin-disulfide reductase
MEKNKKIYQVAILGGGPAAATAGVYAKRKKIETILIAESFGGQSTTAAEIDNLPAHAIPITGAQMAMGFQKRLERSGIDIVLDKVSLVKKEKEFFKIKTDNKGEILAEKIIIALGRKYRDLNVPGEEKYKGKGVAHCSTCDAPLFKDKKVAIIGGGNTAFNSAIDLIPYASEIYILIRSEKIKADNILIEKVKKEEKVKIIFNANTEEISGNDFVERIKYKNLKTKEINELSVQGIFVNIGMIPNISPVKELVKLNEYDEIIVNPVNGRTSFEGIWAAGDITNMPYKQILTACGDAVRSILDIYDCCLEK